VRRYRTAYPPDWKAISRRIRFERARGQCEWCGAVNYQPHPVTGSKVVLTVAHLGAPMPDGTPVSKLDTMDCREENLAALCQPCHLSFDRDIHGIHFYRRVFRRRHANALAAHGKQLELDYG
jgi:hypothetical protein